MRQFLARDSREVIKELRELNRRFSGKTVLITGAAGFLGSHFLHYFLQLNESHIGAPCKIIAWDNFIRDKPEWVNEIIGTENLQFETRSILTSAIAEEIDFVIHAASIAAPKFYRKHPIETMDTNVTGTRNILEYCRAHTVESMLFMSTSEVYGDPTSENIPTPEEYWGHVNCIGPRSCYDESKRYGETLCVNFNKRYDVPVKIVRPFNNYGAGLKPEDGRVISDFFCGILTENKIKLFSDGKATRTFCYVSDAVEGYLRVLLSGHNGEVFNIGAEGPEISILHLAEKIRGMVNNDVAIEFANSEEPEYNTDSPRRRCPSIVKARKLVGYHPKISLDEGLQLTYDYYNFYFKYA